jgi:hypothetical protein
MFTTSDKSIVLRAFNKHFFEFMDDLVAIFPENENVLVARETFETFKKANPTIIAKVWYSKVYSPYSEQITQGNIDFFMEKDYSDDLSNANNAGRVLDMINNVRDPLKQMDEKNRAHATKYIQNLSQLSVAYASLSN